MRSKRFTFSCVSHRSSPSLWGQQEQSVSVEKEYVYEDLIREIDEKMTVEMLADICRDCEWFPISACRKNICGAKD